jgi:4-hydroxy-tetrahydrodipicolinate synthase
MTPTAAINGVLPVIQTLYTADGTIDGPGIEKELDWILDQQVAGLTTGMVSDLLRLTEGERHQLAEIVTAKARQAGRFCIIGCGAESTHTAVAHARHAQRHGADAVMAIPPLAVVLDDDAIFGYYAAIAESIDIGLVVQDASGYVGRPLSLEVQVRLFERFPGRIYFKPEAPPIGRRLSQLRDATGGQARAFEGLGGAALLDSFRRGVVGTMPSSQVCWAVQRLWTALVEGQWDTAYSISGLLNCLISLQTTIDGYIAVEKYLLVKQNVIPTADTRGPQGFDLDDETKSEVDRLFARLSVAAA